MTRRARVVVVPDGASDRHRVGGRSPLELARTPYMDQVARDGVSGRMRTLYPDLPRGRRTPCSTRTWRRS